MHIYIAVSTIYIGFLIYKSCTRKPEDDDEYYSFFPTNHYISKINLFRFFNFVPSAGTKVLGKYDEKQNEDIYLYEET